MKIPILRRREQITGSSGGVPMDSNIPSIAPAISSIGRSISNLGIDLADHSLRMQKQDEDNKIANLAIQFDNNLANDYIDYHQQLGDKAYGSQERLEAFQQSQIKAITKDVDNPRVTQGITQYIQNKINNRRIDYAGYEAGQRQQVSIITRDTKLDSVSQSAFNGIGTLDENINNVRDFIKTQHDNGEISTDTASEWLLNAERKVAERTVAGMINRTPTAAIEIMGSGAFNKYLDSKAIEHYTNEARQEAHRQELIQKAALTEQRKALEDTANKEMTDALLDGNLDTNILGKHRNSLSPAQYESWVKDYNTQVNNLNKSVNEEKSKTVESDLYVKALTSDQLSTSQGLADFKQEIAGKVARKELDPVKARQLLDDATEIDKGNPERKAAITQSINSIEVAYKNGILGDGMESTIEREKMVRDLRAWSIQNPDKDPVEFTEKILTAKRESWIKGLFRILPGVSLFTSPPAESQTPQEVRKSIMEKPVLPTKEELGTVIKESGFKNKSQVLQYIQNKHNMTQQEALNFYDGLK